MSFSLQFICHVTDLNKVRTSLKELGMQITSAGIDFMPRNHSSLDQDQLDAAYTLIEALSDNPDVVRVWDNIQTDSWVQRRDAHCVNWDLVLYISGCRYFSMSSWTADSINRKVLAVLMLWRLWSGPRAYRNKSGMHSHHFSSAFPSWLCFSCGIVHKYASLEWNNI